MNTKKKKRKLKKKSVIICAIVLLMLMICFIKIIIDENSFFDKNAVDGYPSNKTAEKIKADEERVIEDGSYHMEIAAIVLFKDADGYGIINIENIKANHYYATVEITLDDTGEVIYKSKGIKPGQYIEKIKLKKKLDDGEYNATAMFTAYDQKTLETIGQVGAGINIYIKK